MKCPGSEAAAADYSTNWDRQRQNSDRRNNCVRRGTHVRDSAERRERTSTDQVTLIAHIY
jgi:hypothetical protein